MVCPRDLRMASQDCAGHTMHGGPKNQEFSLFIFPLRPQLQTRASNFTPMYFYGRDM